MAPDDEATVLVVDDEPMVRRVLRLQLERLGWRAAEAGDGDSALAVLSSLPEATILVADVNLAGGLSGFELARAARALRPALPVLLLSGDVAAGDAAGPLERAPAPLVKPVSRQALERGLADAVALAQA